MIITLPDNRRKGNQHRSPTPTGAAAHPKDTTNIRLICTHKGSVPVEGLVLQVCAFCVCVLG